MDEKAEQYYPTYSFKKENRDIVLLEFEEAQKIANSQTKVYGQVANVLIAVITILIPFFFDSDKVKSEQTLNIIKANALLFALILIAFGGILLRYFVELQKQITINARKAVTLRAMLGLDYGTIHLTLPNSRVEGASNPFAIKYFTGWLRFQSIPFWVLAIGMNVIWWLATNSRPALIIFPEKLHFSWYFGNILLTFWYWFVFRRNLNDLYETTYLNIVKCVAYLLRVDLVDNFEYVIYRMKLSYIELDRLKVDYEPIKKILIEIEDSSFGKKPISIKSLFRAFLSQFQFFRKKLGLIRSGGSTIKMQLVRSSFIKDVSKQNKWTRKIIEILLSFWLTRKFHDFEIIKLYISSVRYEKGVLGLSEAVKHFFDVKLKNKKLSDEEAFFLVERLSNITSTVKLERINHLLTRTTAKIDRAKLDLIYNRLVKSGKLK